MITKLLLRGLAAGLAAGLLAGAFAFAFSEPLIDRAIAIEEAAAASGGHHGAQAPPPVSRDGQRAGLFLASALYGMAVGGLFALAFAVARGRAGARTDWSTATGLSAALFAAVALVPGLKYPANPPAVGDPHTIATRTGLYLILIAIALLALVAAWRVWRQLESRGPAARQVAAGAVFTVTVGVALLVLPSVNEVARGFPADLLWEFRLASLGTQAVLWASLGVGFGLALELRPLAKSRRAGGGAARPRPAPAADDT